MVNLVIDSIRNAHLNNQSMFNCRCRDPNAITKSDHHPDQHLHRRPAQPMSAPVDEPKPTIAAPVTAPTSTDESKPASETPAPVVAAPTSTDVPVATDAKAEESTTSTVAPTVPAVPTPEAATSTVAPAVGEPVATAASPAVPSGEEKVEIKSDVKSDVKSGGEGAAASVPPPSSDQVILPPSFFKHHNLDGVERAGEFTVTIGKKDDKSTHQVVWICDASMLGVSHGPHDVRDDILACREHCVRDPVTGDCVMDPVTGEPKCVREDPADPKSQVFEANAANKVYHEQLKAAIKQYNDTALALDSDAEAKGKLWKQSDIPDAEDESGGCNPQLHSQMAFLTPHIGSDGDTTKALHEGKGKIIALYPEDLKKWLRDNVVGIDHRDFERRVRGLPENYRKMSPEELDEAIKPKRSVEPSEDGDADGLSGKRLKAE